MRAAEIVLVDYGAGNLRSVQKALEAVCGPSARWQVRVASTPQAVAQAGKLVLPGVGAFGDGMRNLVERGLAEAITGAVHRQVPLLGICLGMQLLFEWSEELGHHAGLGLLPGCVRRLDFAVAGSKNGLGAGLKVPHTSWNQILPNREDPLLRGIHPGDYAYFNHSFYCEPSRDKDVLAKTEYGLRFASLVNRDRLWGAQFHPEKSQAVGLQILQNFVEVI